MKKKSTIAIIIVLLFLVICLFLSYLYPSLNDKALHSCQSYAVHTFGGDKEEYLDFCNCELKSVANILNKSEYKNWLTSYISDETKAKNYFYENTELSIEYLQCLVDKGPIKMWEQKGANEAFTLVLKLKEQFEELKDTRMGVKSSLVESFSTKKNDSNTYLISNSQKVLVLIVKAMEKIKFASELKKNKE